MDDRRPKTTVKPIPILKKGPKSGSHRDKLSVRVSSHGNGRTESSTNPHQAASLSHLREENSHLLDQSYRLISDLESTSHQLLKANSQIHDLRGELDRETTDSSKDRVAVLEAQLKLMEDKFSKNVNAETRLEHVTNQQEREKEEWTLKHQAMKDQLSTLQHECRRLHDSATSTVSTSSTSAKPTSSSGTPTPTVTSYGSLLPTTYSTTKPYSSDTDSVHSQSRYPFSPNTANLSSTTSNFTTRTTSLFTKPSAHSYRYTPRFEPKSSSGASVTFVPESVQNPNDVQSHVSVPLANSTLLDSSHLSGSVSSLSSVQSTQSAREYSSRFQERRYPSYRSSHQYPTHTSTPHSSERKHKYIPGNEPVTLRSSSVTRTYNPSSSGVNSYYSTTRQYKPPSSQERVNKPPPTKQYKPLSSNERVNGLSSSSSSSVGYSSWRSGTSSKPSATIHQDVRGGSYSKPAPTQSIYNKTGNYTSPSLSDNPNPPSIQVHRATDTQQVGSKDTSSHDSDMSPQTDLSVSEKSPQALATNYSMSSMRSGNDIHSPVSVTSSVAEGDLSTRMELERAHSKIRQLEKEVNLLEKQLADKTQSAKHHVEELTQMRVELAQERSSLAILKQEIKDNAAEELGRTRAIHSQQCTELQDQIEKMKKEKKNVEREMDSAKASLKEKVESLSTDLTQSQEQLLHKTELATNLQRELTETRSELQKGTSLWRQRENEMRQSLDQNDILRNSLSKQIERLNQEVKEYSSRVSQQGEMSSELVYARSEIERIGKVVPELEDRLKQTERDFGHAKEEEKRLRFELTQEQFKNNELVRKLEHSEVLLQEEVRRRDEAETKSVRLESDVERLGSECEECRREVREVEARTRQREEEVEGTLGHMQQELAKRAQQVLEMDGLLRTHQAETAARRLQLERMLTQRQADIRTRTQELEELMIKYSGTKKREEELKQEVDHLRNSEHSLTSQRNQELHSKESKLSSLERQLKEVESVGVVKTRECKELKEELESLRIRENESRDKWAGLEKQVTQLSRENDSLREQHLNRVQRLQETHSTLLTSREQQATSHRFQLKELIDQEKARQEELSRCRAQVASLSAELAAERRVSDEARQQVAVRKAECIKYQTQVSSLEKALSVNGQPLQTDSRHTKSTANDSSGQPTLPAFQTSNLLGHHIPQPLYSSGNVTRGDVATGPFVSLPPHLYSAPGRGSPFPAKPGDPVVGSEFSEGVRSVEVGAGRSANFTPMLPKTNYIKGGIVNI